MPFRFPLDSDGKSGDLVCTRVTRLLPGKRLVCLGDLNDQQVVVKFYLDPGGAKRHFSRELKGVHAFQSAGVKTPQLISAGRYGGAYVLCFQRISPAEDLFAASEKQTDDAQKIRLLSRAVLAVADQHNAGLKQEDLHRENFLLSGDEVYSIDGDAVNARKMGKPLSEKESLKNLGLFFTHLYPYQVHLIPDIFKVYAEKRGWQPTDRRIRRLFKAVYRQKQQRKQEYLKKIFRECTEFVCSKKWNRFMVCRRDRYTPELADLLEDPDAFMASGELLKSGNTATVALARAGGSDVVIKRYNIKSFGHGLNRFFRPSRAWMSWRNAHRLTYMDIPTPVPVALIERRWGPFRRKAYFITEAARGIPLNHLFASETLDGAAIDKELKRLESIFQSMATARIWHGDFKASNFIVSKEDIKVVDLDVMMEYRYRWAFQKAFQKDLKRFMKNWTDIPEIERKCQQMLERIKQSPDHP